MSGISFTGVGSGIPVGDIVKGLVNAEKQPFEARMKSKKSDLSTDISAMGTFKGSLDKVKSSLENLSKLENFQKRTASGSDDFITLTSDKTAQPGQFDIKVNNLAQAHKSMSSTFAASETVGSGTLTFATADASATFDITVDPSDTLVELRSKINDSMDNDSTIATIITESDGSQRLVMTAKETGVDNAINVTAVGVTGRLNDFTTASLTELTPAKDSSITIDGAINLTSSTNEFKDAIQGVTINVTKAHDVDENSSIAISEDNKIVEDTLNEFVTAYNEYVALADKLGKAGGEGEAGALSGDSMLRSIESKFRNQLSSSFDTINGGSMSLTELGVSADRYGKLSFDNEKLNEQLAIDPNAVQAFFIGTDAKPGFAASVDSFIKTYTESSGLVDSRVKNYNNQMKDLDESSAAFTRKIDKYEARLFAQYNAMDAMVANMNSTSNYVMSQLNSMPSMYN